MKDSPTANTQLTKAQADGLRRIRDGGPYAWTEGVRSRSGGAIRRMFLRMAKDGLCTDRPFCITAKGRKALEAYKWPTP